VFCQSGELNGLRTRAEHIARARPLEAPMAGRDTLR
jgi:hypothetical protein